DFALAFADIHPQAPTHILVIPTGAYTDIADFNLNARDEEITGFWRAVAWVAKDSGLPENGFRLIANTGLNGGQEVPHFHVHLLGGRALGPMLQKVSA
ncbi:MAG: HIT domain-containing protein, partial [Alphaproteobacteria bacterium]|nr:HIT domain-containing protein [Alphaproteobacteria bacterium]